MEKTLTMTKHPSLLKSKLKAAGIHLIISGVIFLVLAYFIIFHWYPFPYFTADGGWQGIRIVALIDLVLGPLLTLIIFNPNKRKREIRFDLSMIALFQISALAWGIYTVQNERTAAIVHWDGEFYAMPAKRFHEQGISLSDLSQFSNEHPPLIHAYRPTDIETLHKVLKLSTEENQAPFEQFHLYRSFNKYRDNIFTHSLNIDEITTANENMKAEMEQFLAKNGGNKEDYFYMPLNARYHNVVLIFSRDGDVLGSLNAPYKVMED